MRQFIAVIPALAIAACAIKPACAPPNTWLAPGSLAVIPDPLPRAATAPAVLLGERHDSPVDHRWELATLQRLYALNPRLALGFEMFPRSTQPVLDQWVAGRLTEAELLGQTDWDRVWGFDAGFYLPLFRFARDHHLPMRALNVSRHLVREVATGGWQSAPLADREGVTQAAPPSAAYRARLNGAMSGHAGPPMTPQRLDHFIQAQLVWDRAMAEAIAAQRAADPTRTVVAFMGAGHAQYFEGVPHQMQALGLGGAVVLLTDEKTCAPLDPNYATAIYVE
jgi:uncharacterized iron-regulated protein